MNQQSSKETLSFPQAITAAKSLIQKINSQQLSEAEIEYAIFDLLINRNGGRGFFVSYLTSDANIADQPSIGIIKGLKSSIQIAGKLLVKNLAMSSAMIIHHQLNEDLDNIESSRTVCKRTKNIIRKLNHPLVRHELQALLGTIDDQSQEYRDFIDRWDYTQDQKTAIKEAIIAVSA